MEGVITKVKNVKAGRADENVWGVTQAPQTNAQLQKSRGRGRFAHKKNGADSSRPHHYLLPSPAEGKYDFRGQADVILIHFRVRHTGRHLALFMKK